MTPLPDWVQVVISLLKPVEVAALGLLVWWGKTALADRKIILSRLAEINGNVKRHQWWIDGHEEWTRERNSWTAEKDRRVNERLTGLEERERERLMDDTLRSRPPRTS